MNVDKTEAVQLRGLHSGQCFRFDDDEYIVTDECTNDEKAYLLCVNLFNGNIVRFSPDLEVIELDAELHIAIKYN